MKQKKMGFFKRVKNAVINFDEYSKFSEEKIFIGIKYFLKLLVIFTLVITLAISIKMTEVSNEVVSKFKNEFPNFKFENNILIIEEEQKQFNAIDEWGYLEIIVDSQKENLDEIEDSKQSQMLLAFLKDKIILRNINGIENIATYQEISNKYDLTKVNKQTILDGMFKEDINEKIIMMMSILILSTFIIFLIQIFLDVVLLSLLGFIISKIIGIKLKYKSIFKMSIYALTLSIILYMGYILLLIFTGFEIVYFSVAYRTISYIYIITAMLMMKSDLIKQQMEVGKIVQEQRKIREESNNKEKEKQEKDKEDKNKKEEKKDKNKEEGTPEGSKA